MIGETTKQIIRSVVVSGVSDEEPPTLATATVAGAAAAAATTARITTRTAPSPSQQVGTYVGPSGGMPHDVDSDMDNCRNNNVDVDVDVGEAVVGIGRDISVGISVSGGAAKTVGSSDGGEAGTVDDNMGLGGEVSGSDTASKVVSDNGVIVAEQGTEQSLAQAYCSVQ